MQALVIYHSQFGKLPELERVAEWAAKTAGLSRVNGGVM
jgi:hypothetical protein